MDLFEKCQAGIERVEEAVREGYYPYFIPLDESEGPEAVVRGQRVIMAGSNNYLGLTTHPKVRQAAIDAVHRYGTSCTGSRFLNGNLALHEQLERELADWVGMEAALVFSTGYQTNLGTISSLVQKGDFVVTDKDDHASIIDGAKMSYGRMARFRHNDMDSLAQTLQKIPAGAGSLVVVDGVFSMGGDIAPLPEMIEVCQRYGARLMVDDAHSIGVLGGGRGTAAYYGISEGIDLVMGTFSKAFASLGGFIAGNRVVIEYIKHNARSLIFSASMTPPNAAAALASLHVMRDEPERNQHLWDLTHHLHKSFRAMGFNIGNTQTPIIPVIIGDEMKTFAFWQALLDAGVFVNPVIPPGVPPNMSLLRTSYMATHTDEQIDRLLATFQQVGQALGVI